MRFDSAAADAFIHSHVAEWMQELRELCAIPSVSARHEAIEPCAAMVGEMLERRGFRTTISSVPGGHPVVIGHATGSVSGRTMLFYNHYDVQPPEPLGPWQSPPFELTERDGAVYARGAKDDKGEFVARLAAIDAVRAVTGEYPCSLTWLAEGEEEVGSPHLPDWFAQHEMGLKADAAIWEEGQISEEGRPVVRLGARGLLYVELSAHTIARDAHSGSANLLPNAAWRLVWALNSIKGPDGKILIKGFYDDVRSPSALEESMLAVLPDTAADFRREFELDRLLDGVTHVERAYFTPTANIAGVGAGYQGEGSKTVIPADAKAKMDFRLVPDQDPLDILRKLRRHLAASGFEDVKVEVLGAEPPGVTDPSAPIVRLTAEVAEEVYGKPAIIVPLTGGTTPMFLFTRQGVPVINPGVGWGSRNRAHSPNEFMRLGDFENAARHIARLLIRFAGD
ncbi:MAG TPA: M20/M25/M40 family metallo-hydrolase [Candidatus Dormibacteraeota bacterium]|nr:M20/M25/M40 family metallo-hydrolase [Candidatus Dormibacteraeota bacterium]